MKYVSEQVREKRLLKDLQPTSQPLDEKPSMYDEENAGLFIVPLSFRC
jgi:hypothetical protein